jgi:photosystem II stability/assembly factor-like uncharacterized protein
MFFPTISPHDPNTVLVRCDMTGAYISHDAGGSWRMFNLRGPVHFFVFDPVDSKVIYAQTIGLWRSTDQGRTWRLVHPEPANVKGIIMPDDHASEHFVTRNGNNEFITALAVDPANSKVLYAAMTNRDSHWICVSKDWGCTWSKAGELPSRGRKIYVDPQSRPQDRTLYVINAVSVSVRCQGQWVHGSRPPGTTAFADASAGFPKGGGIPVIYAVGPAHRKGNDLEGGVVVSNNGGQDWISANQSICRRMSPAAREPLFQAVAACVTQPKVAYLSYKRLQTGPLKEQTYFGVMKTTNSGANWIPVWEESVTESAASVHDSWITKRFGPEWGENPISLGVAPNNSEICYSTDYGRTLRTTDGGRNWEAVYSRSTDGGTSTTTGLDVTTCYGVHFDPFEQNRAFISYTDIGLFASEDSGRSWRSVTLGVPDRWVNTTYWIVFDPEDRGRAWGVMSGIHDLPRPKMWRRQQPSHYNGGVCLSEDGGRSWRQSTEGMPPTAATHVLLDPRSPVRSRTLYVAGFGRGVFKSVNGGHSWTLKNYGIQGDEPFAWRLVMDRDGVLYLVVARKTEDGSYGNTGDGALYRSRDGAEHWERITLPEGVNGPNGLAIDSDDPKRLHLAAWGRNTTQRAVSGGVFLSADGGCTWRNVLDKDQHVYDVTLDPRRPGLVYACGFESSAWRSKDRGETWKRLRGYNFKWGHRVIPDPKDPNMIYITTFGGSVWHGPAKGDPSAIEDIVTPEVAYGR